MVQEFFQQDFWKPRCINVKCLPLTNCGEFETIRKAVTKIIIHIYVFQLQ
jgi:hypothetical protein